MSDVDFEAFVARHAHLEKRGVVVAADDNDAMTSSYVMVTPDVGASTRIKHGRPLHVL